MSNSRIEELVQRIESLQDAGAREAALELAREILEFHRAAFERTIEVLHEVEGNGPAILDALTREPKVSSVLVLHDLHPLDLETRVRRALEDSSLGVCGTKAELVSTEDGVVRVRVQGGMTKQVLEVALWEAAPDAAAIVVEGAADQFSDGFVPLQALLTHS